MKNVKQMPVSVGDQLYIGRNEGISFEPAEGLIEEFKSEGLMGTFKTTEDDYHHFEISLAEARKLQVWLTEFIKDAAKQQCPVCFCEFVKGELIL